MKILFPISKIRASKELDSSKRHTISPNGYNIGRDWFVERAVTGGMWKGMWWKADVEWRTDLIKEGKKGLPLQYSLSISAYTFCERCQPRDCPGWTRSHPYCCPTLTSRLSIDF